MCHRCERVVAILKRSLCTERGWHNIYTIKTLDRQHISSCTVLLPPVVSRRKLNVSSCPPKVVSVCIGFSFPLPFVSSVAFCGDRRRDGGGYRAIKRLEKLHTFNYTHTHVHSEKPYNTDI